MKVKLINEIISHEQKIGRKDPYFCGSGKKYKLCCLKCLQAPIDFAWKNLRRLEGQVIDEYLGPYIENHIPEHNFVSAVDDLLPEEEMPEEMGKQLFSSNFSTPLFLFNRIPKEDHGLEDFEIDKPIALQYIKKYPNRLNAQQKNFMEVSHCVK